MISKCNAIDRGKLYIQDPSIYITTYSSPHLACITFVCAVRVSHDVPRLDRRGSSEDELTLTTPWTFVAEVVTSRLWHWHRLGVKPHEHFFIQWWILRLISVVRTWKSFFSRVLFVMAEQENTWNGAEFKGNEVLLLLVEVTALGKSNNFNAETRGLGDGGGGWVVGVMGIEIVVCVATCLNRLWTRLILQTSWGISCTIYWRDNNCTVLWSAAPKQ